MGADSCVSTGWTARTLRQPKVFRNGDFLIGYAGSVRMLNVLRYQVQIGSQDAAQTDDEYVMCSFIEAVREQCKDLGVSTIEDNQEQSVGSFLVAYRQKLYDVAPDFSVCSYADDLYACGSGSDIALGAMAALQDMEPVARIRRALGIAERYGYGVAGPFHVEIM